MSARQPDRCKSVAVRARHRRLIKAVGPCEDVVATDLITPSEDPSNLWTTEIVLDVRWASVPAHLLEAIAEYDLGVADVSPQGQPAQLVVTIR